MQSRWDFFIFYFYNSSDSSKVEISVWTPLYFGPLGSDAEIVTTVQYLFFFVTRVQNIVISSDVRVYVWPLVASFGDFARNGTKT